MFDLIVLAAGAATRFGENKLTYCMHGKPVLVRLVEQYLDTPDIENIYIITGFPQYRKNIESVCRIDDRIQFLHNPDYSRGMFSSILTGLAGLGERQGGIILHPGDTPFVLSATITRLLDTFRKSPGRYRKIFIPSHKYKSGHPIIIGSEHRNAITEFSADSSLRAYIKKMHDSVEYVTVADGGVLKDIDYKSDCC